MELARPGCLWLLVLLPALGLLGAWGRRRARADWDALGAPGALPPGRSGFVLVALALLILALAGPRWGMLPGEAQAPGHDVALLVDVSWSMAAQDALPDRLGLAVEGAGRLIEAVGAEVGGRVGVVAFAGRGVPRCPLTSNLGAAADTLASLRAGDVRPGGSDLGAALVAGLDLLTEPGEPAGIGGRTLVVLSDGETHAAVPDAVLERLRESGVIVHAVAVGDAERGHPIPRPAPKTGAIEPMQFEGEVVLSRRRDDVLEAVARATGGTFVRLGLSRPDSLGALYREQIAPGERRVRAGREAPERPERYAWFVLPAAVLGVLGSRPRGGRRLIAAALVLAVLPGASGGSSAETAAEAVERGRAAYGRGEFATALEAFGRAIVLDPGAAIPRYDAAATLYRLSRFAEADGRYAEAAQRGEPAMQARVALARGNTAYAMGDLAGALRCYDECLATTVAGAEAVREDARINREFVARLTESRKPAPEESGAGRGPDESARPPEASEKDQAPKESETPDRPPGDVAADPQGDRARPEETEMPPTPTPQGRLAAALRQARDARQRLRLPETVPFEDDRTRKDW